MGRNVIAGAGFVLFWSSGFVGATLGSRSSGAVTLLAWRFIVAGLLLGAWWVFRRRSMRPRDVAVQAGLGVLSQGAYLYFVYAAADLGVAPGTSALIAALQPIVAVVLGQFVLGERAGPLRWAGLVAGLAGVALVVGGDLSGRPGTPVLAYGMPFLAMLALVAATLVERRTASDVPLADGLVVQCVTSMVLFTGIAAATGQLVPPRVPDFWFAIGWVVLFSTFGGYGCYWLVLRRSSVTTVSTLLYLTPPTTMVLAWIMFGDTITLRGLLGLVVCLAAVVLVLRRPRKLSEGREMMTACSSPTSSPPPPR
ncbi:DMT family transporter [Amycolatopsis thermophila]|uniref:Drug/metabolite transporter (DMT)-like permease n=1 Tax=Amycolatopsis thermophila TaxID=206084 RepID=A0ABU0EVA2_9PSEU|nr:DMT family transporter [Amycolatopsis thermophila]MDQ0379233.1 drug/metabolite transporter (DMT)-like permease [Amycolatopsis thermophila]